MDEGGPAGRPDSGPRGGRSPRRTANAQRPPPSFLLVAVVVVVVVLTQSVKADCDRLPAVSHGSVEYTLDGSNHTTSAMITCQENYRLVGSDVRICLQNDTWNGTQPSCQLVTCESLPTIPNGQVQHEGTTMYIGSVAKYKCIKRFRLVGAANRTCQADATWSGIQPECVRIVCKHPGAPVNGKALPEDVTDYPAGTTIQYTCREGYNLEGPESIECSEEGIWTSEIPNCQITDCGIPPVIPHATANYTDTVMGHNVTYTCFSGHEATSQTVLICMASGNWSGAVVPCIEVTIEESTDSILSTPQTTAPELAGTSSSKQSTTLVQSSIDPVTTYLPNVDSTTLPPTSRPAATTETTPSLFATKANPTTVEETTILPTYSSTANLPHKVSSPLDSEASTSVSTFSTTTSAPETTAEASSSPTTLLSISTTESLTPFTITGSGLTASDVASETDQTTGHGDLTTAEGALLEPTATVTLTRMSMAESGVLTKGVLVGVGCGLALTLVCLTTVACLVRKRRCRGQYDVTMEDPVQPSYRSMMTSGKRHHQGNGHVISAVGNGHDNTMANYCDGGCRSSPADGGHAPVRVPGVTTDRGRNHETHLQMNSSPGGFPPEPGGRNVYISDPRSNVDSCLEHSKPPYYNRTAL